MHQLTLEINGSLRSVEGPFILKGLEWGSGKNVHV